MSGLKVKVAILGLLAAGSGCAIGLEKRFQAHVDYLASDELMGRGVGSEGIERAAEYIAERFAEVGLEPAGDDGTYFQTFSMTLERRLTEDSRLALTGGPVDRKLGVGFVPLPFSSDAEFRGELAFVGYGIENPQKEHDDFAHVDLNGSVALMFCGEPPSWVDETGASTRHSLLRDKVYNAKDRGAVAALFVNPAPLGEEGDRLPVFRSRGADDFGIPAMHVTRRLANSILAANLLPTLDDLQAKLDRGERASSPVGRTMVSGKAGFEKTSAPTRNVLGLLRGAGPPADEYVVIGAHYDHLGIREPMMRRFSRGQVLAEVREPEIHNGADDNASGTSGLLECARLLASGPPPPRSILFVAFTAEESGLHGSKHFVQRGPVPINKVVAMLNLDMIGRLDRDHDALQVLGADTGEGLEELIRSHARNSGLEVAFAGGMGGRSDNASFDRRGVPAVHYYSGAHGDYHKPSDDADKINAAGGARITRLVADVARDLATRRERVVFVKPKKAVRDRATAGTPAYRVVMGLTPSYGDDGKAGMAVDAVSPEGPADLAGMKAGDRIVRISGKPVENIYDYMASTRTNKAGDTVRVVVLRGEREVRLNVTLAAAQ